MYRYICASGLLVFLSAGCGTSSTAESGTPKKAAAPKASATSGSIETLTGVGGSFVSNREPNTPPKCDMAGARDAAGIRVCIRAQEAPIRACYATALDGDDTVAGMVRVQLVVGPNGDVDEVALVKTTVNDGELERCVLGAVGNWLFPAGTPKLRIEYPFKFRATD